MLFMVVEKLRNRDGKPVYRKLRELGRALPIQRWIADWQDVVEFEAQPTVESKTTREAPGPIL